MTFVGIVVGRKNHVLETLESQINGIAKQSFRWQLAGKRMSWLESIIPSRCHMTRSPPYPIQTNYR